MKIFTKIFLLLFVAITFFSCGDDNPVTPPVGDKPEITSISPIAVMPGDNLTISGKFFGAVRDTSKVYFNDLLVETYVSWTDNEIQVKVPAITTSGTIKVVVNKLVSNSMDYMLDDTPRIAMVGSGSAKVGAEIEIIGVNFTVTQGTVEFNSLNAPDISLWTNTRIVVKVPENATTGNVVVKAGTKASKGFFFTILPPDPPVINSIAPSTAKVGAEITITGNYFGDTQGVGYVDFNGIQASDYTSWSNTSIKVKVPANVNSGPLKVVVGSMQSNSVSFTLLVDTPDPIITSLNKNTFKSSDEISITGKNFGNSKTAASKVIFNGIESTNYPQWSSTLIKVIVPIGTTSGKVVVVVDGKSSNSVDYTIESPGKKPSITSVTPTLAPSGDIIQIYGSNFGNSSGANAFVMFGAVKAATSNWSDTWITATVPEMASGATKITVTVDGNKSNESNFTVQSKAVVIVEMVEIPAGSFMMGHSNPLMEDAYPQHKVTFTKPLLVAKTEISQAQYKKVMNQLNPSRILDDNNPVEQLTWYAACDFCNRLSKLEGYTEAYIIDGTDVTLNKSANGYRLLTEAEWEYACRAGSTGDMGKRGGVEAAPDDIAWTTNNTKAMKHVGLLKPNDFGLYDMQGNAAEWVWDYYDYYGEDDETNPTGPSDGIERVFRGGGYIDSPTNCSTYKRSSINGLQIQYYIGFRICRTK